MMHVVTFTNLFPSQRFPRRGIFVQERLRAVLGTGAVSSTVVALRPRLPFASTKQEFALDDMADVPVRYCGVPSFPKLSNWFDPFLWANAAQGAVQDALRGRRSGSIIDAHFLYPDAAAALILGKRLGVPVIASARGSDVNVKCEGMVVRRWVRWLINDSAALVTVSAALRARLIKHGFPAEKLNVIRNGVDISRFYRRDVEECRQFFGVSGRVLAVVGHLLRDKGQHIAVEALEKLPDATLLVVGEGPEWEALHALARRLKVADRVIFTGNLSHLEMPMVYSAADATVLMSAREGMPNVVLESLACGTRVIATDVGGVTEVVDRAELGQIATERSASALVSAVHDLFSNPAEFRVIADCAASLSWGSVAMRQVALYDEVLGQRK